MVCWIYLLLQSHCVEGSTCTSNSDAAAALLGVEAALLEWIILLNVSAFVVIWLDFPRWTFSQSGQEQFDGNFLSKPLTQTFSLANPLTDAQPPIFSANIRPMEWCKCSTSTRFYGGLIKVRPGLLGCSLYVMLPIELIYSWQLATNELPPAGADAFFSWRCNCEAPTPMDLW